ncbi:MAG: ATP-dependent RecD-like helicase [Thermoleophilia bacterium]|nr:ATP-dependent RecD-like helicase [Thermoleophilia bacterium]
MPQMSAGPKRSRSAGSRFGASDPEFYRKRALPPAPADETATTIAATIDAVVYANAEGTFSILRAIDEHDNKVVLKGGLAHVHVGEHLTCTGKWQQHTEHGWSFMVDHAEASQPHTTIGMIAYLESCVHGIGPIWAKAIVETLGTEVFTLIDADPQVLFNVRTPSGRKMSAKQIREIISEWENSRAVRRVMHFLTSHGVTTGIATKIHKQYGDTALERMQENPYCIVEIRGIGFKIADRIARNLNVPLESPARIRAGIRFCLEEGEGDGHCFLTDEELARSIEKHLFVDPLDATYVDSRPDETIKLDVIIANQLEELVRDNQIVMDVTDDGRRYYLRELYWIEQRLARHVRDLLSTLPAVDVELPTRPTSGDFVPNDGQWQAIENALTSRISIITGLPGTGKTTLVKLLLQVIDEADLRLDGEQERYLLASPTGKAARRLQEATGASAQTIHRLLQWAPSEGGFLHDEGNPLTARFVIVDETSMVDLKLADALFRAIGPTTHLVLVGDADQLPPVGAGKVFDDLIESGCVPSVRLTEIFRQAARSMIVRNAHRIVNGEKPFRNRSDGSVELGVDPEELDDDFFFVHRDEAEDVARTVVEFAAERIPKKYGLDPMRDVLVLAPMKKGPCGLEVLNSKLQWKLNRDGQKLNIKDLRVGDRVIQTRNNYDLEVMNGEVGVLRAWDAEDGIATIDISGDERTVEVPRNQLDSFMLAYAISVHRSQGSQAPAVICVVARSHWNMLTRSLVNTAVTRAQKLCVCVGQHAALGHAVKTVDSRTRNAALAERVAAGGAPVATTRAVASVDPFAGDSVIGAIAD